MNTKTPQTTYRDQYVPAPYSIQSVYLEFDLNPTATQVRARSQFVKNDETEGHEELVLHGDNLKLLSLYIDGKEASVTDYRFEEGNLILIPPSEDFELEIYTEIDPESNTALSGLYRSSGNYCTQCEAEGFRRITFYLDRPDVLAIYTTKIIADQKSYPVLLSNGNLVEEGKLDDGKHYAIWNDPFPKPSYLFALVAGDLSCQDSSFTTRSGRKVRLQIYVEPKNRGKCDHAMRSLIKAMEWDENEFGLEYDLDRYMIVAVDDFNMGAMENKGLNIFNSKYVLSSPETATDSDYLGIESVIAHEYFHNWTGNRVTCRDWFQLSLKEGLTVFRDQEFSADMNSRPVKRISDVNILRTAQFKEDASPMAHPVRPDSYVEINNFYTVTVYNKGAEVIRMLQSIVGNETFNAGIRKYLNIYDGMAVTCDDFVDVMETVSGENLDQFRLWYSQAGTPDIQVDSFWDRSHKQLTINFEQSCKATPGQKKKKPFHIPIELALIDYDTQLDHTGEHKQRTSTTFHLRSKKQELILENIPSKPYVSLLREFSAPVRIMRQQSKDDLAFAMARETDLFNRWEGAQLFSAQVIFENMERLNKGLKPEIDPVYLESFTMCLTDISDPALTAQAITLPAENYLAQQMEVIKPSLLGRAREAVKGMISDKLYDELRYVYSQCYESGEYSINHESIAKRSLKNCCLSYISSAEGTVAERYEVAEEQYANNNNMTDAIAAFTALCHGDYADKQSIVNAFYDRWKNEPLVIDKWLIIQAMSPSKETFGKVKELTQHESFRYDNPNKVRSLIGAFCSGNHYRFHDESGAGYRFLTSSILRLNKKNPQIAARLVSPLISYRRYETKLRSMMEEQLHYILMQKDLSADVYEIVKKSL